MADGPVFGRRNAPPGREKPAYRPAFVPPPLPGRDAAHEAETQKLRATGERAQLIGDIVGFAGLLIVFLASLSWPADPAGLDILDGHILVPEVVSSGIALADPSSWPTRIYADLTEVSPANLGPPLLFLLGIIAVFKRRWVLAGLVAGFMLFPLPVFGLVFPAGLPLAIIIGVIAAFSMVKLRGVGRGAYIIASFFLVPIVTAIVMQAVPPIQWGAKTAYMKVDFDGLKKNEAAEGANGSAASGKTVPLSTLEGLPAFGPEQTAAKAFAMAQEHALRGDAEKAMASLDEAQAGGYPSNGHERKIASAIGDFAIASGRDGASAQEVILSGFKSRLIVSWVIMWIGLAIGLAAPFGDIIATAIRNRLARIAAAREKLSDKNRTAGQSAIPFAGTFEDEPIHSIAASDARDVVEAMGRRIVKYRTAALSFAWATLICLGAYVRFWLPAPDSNTAFNEVALTGWTYYLGRGLGLLTGSEGPSPFTAMGLGPTVVLSGVPIFLLFQRRYRLVGMVGLLVSSLASPMSPMAPLRHPDNPVALEAMHGGIRDALERVAATHKDRGNPKVIEVVSPVTGQRQSIRSGMIVDASTAAYILAQIAYLEDRPQDAARLLSGGIAPGAIDGLIHMQRLALMKEWVAAKGYDLSAEAAETGLPKPVSFVRVLGRLFGALTLLTAILAIVPAVLLAIAWRRRSRIETLVAARTRLRMPVQV